MEELLALRMSILSGVDTTHIKKYIGNYKKNNNWTSNTRYRNKNKIIFFW